jgi:hypothetical protein
MKLKYIILLLLAFAINAQAQNNTVAGISWSMGFGVGETSDYIGSPSFSGFTIEGHKFVKQNVSVGLMGGWNVFSEKNNSTVNIGNAALSGEQGRYLNVFPILVNASLYMSNKNSKFVPFIRAHVGTYYIMQRFDIGVYTFNNYNWHFGIAPELGFNITASPEIDILVNAKYNYAFDSGVRLSGDEDNSYSFFTLNFGISYRNW